MTAAFGVMPTSNVDAIAPDGSEVRFLAGLTRGGIASFTIGPGPGVGLMQRRVADVVAPVSTRCLRQFRSSQPSNFHDDVTPPGGRLHQAG